MKSLLFTAALAGLSEAALRFGCVRIPDYIFHFCHFTELSLCHLLIQYDNLHDPPTTLIYT